MILAIGAERDVYLGGGGYDFLSYQAALKGVTASLLAGRGWSGDAAGDVFDGFEGLTGSAQADFLTGDRRNNHLTGLDGDDIFMGNGGDDLLYGGAGSDIAVYSGSKADYLISQAAGATTVSFTSGGFDGVDTLYGIETLRFADGDMLL